MALATAKMPGLSSPAPAPSSEWPDRAVSVLLKTYAHKFSVDRGYLRTQDWQDVAHAVNSVCDHPKTMKQCRDKVDSLKRRYKIEKRKAVSGGDVSWPFFHRLDDIMNAVLKQGKIQYSTHPNLSSANASADADADADGCDDLDIVDEAVDFHKGKEEVTDASARLQERHGELGADGNGDDAKEHHDGLNSIDSLSASSDIPPRWKNSKRVRHTEDNYYVSEEEDDAFNGYSSRHLHYPLHSQNHHRHHQQNSFGLHSDRRPQHVYRDFFMQPSFLVPSRRSTISGGTEESTENASHERVKRTCSRSQKRKHECDNGMDALADAVTGLSQPRTAASFADVLARIEHAKAAILKKVRLELIKLDKTEKKRSWSSRKLHSSLATSC